MELTDKIALALATGFHVSYIPGKFYKAKKWTGAGLLGTMEGLLLAPFLPEKAVPLLAVLAASILASCWLCGRAEKVLGSHDDSRIVLDEIVGLWTAIAFLPRTARVMIAGFVLFRFLDSVKLPPYRWLERLPGGYGIVLDDVGAGLAANLILRGLMPCWGWLGA